MTGRIIIEKWKNREYEYLAEFYMGSIKLLVPLKDNPNFVWDRVATQIAPEYILMSRCYEKLNDLRRAKSVLNTALKYAKRRRIDTFVEASVAWLDVKLGNKEPDDLPKILDKFADAEFDIPEFLDTQGFTHSKILKEILKENEAEAKELLKSAKETHAKRQADEKLIADYNNLKQKKTELKAKIDDLETKKVLGQVNEEEFRKFKSSYVGVLAKVKERLIEIEKEVQEMGLSEEDLKVEDELTKEELDEMLMNDEITICVANRSRYLLV